MEKHLVEFELEDGSVILVESEGKGGGVQRVSRGDGETATEKAQSKFVEAINRVRPAADVVLKSFQEMNTPDEIGLEFGVKFSAKAGAIIASADSEATFKVSLKWKNEKKEG